MKFRIKIIIGIIIVYLIFVISRFGEFTTYIPLSGKIFDVDKENVTMVMLQNGKTGETMYLKDRKMKINQRVLNVEKDGSVYGVLFIT